MSLGCCLSDLLQKTICLQGCQRCLGFIKKGGCCFFRYLRADSDNALLVGLCFSWRFYRCLSHQNSANGGVFEDESHSTCPHSSLQKETFTWQGANVKFMTDIPYHPISSHTIPWLMRQIHQLRLKNGQNMQCTNRPSQAPHLLLRPVPHNHRSWWVVTRLVMVATLGISEQTPKKMDLEVIVNKLT